MATISALEDLAITRFQQHWARRAHDAGRRGDTSVQKLYQEICPMPWLIRDLVHLISDRSSESMQQLEPKIRRVVGEHDFLGAGDASVSQNHGPIRERVVIALIEVLSEIRDEAKHEGLLPSSPASQLMCG